MFGHGCEWQLDAKTGLSTCVAVVDREHNGNARFGFGPKDSVYLAVGGGWAPAFTTRIYQRLGAGEWKLRTKLMPINKEGQVVSETAPRKGTV